MQTEVKPSYKPSLEQGGLYRRYFKRSLDVVLSIIGLITLLPIFLIIALAIKVDSKGPVFFKQDRLGKNGKVFKIMKFRTMVVGAEKIGDGLSIKSQNDNRITRFGNILRTTSLDELPQLINVILGKMSLIGPRPPVTYFPYDGFDNYPEGMKKRFDVRPGITGLSQVRERNNTTWERRILTDNEYIDNLSIRYDINILFNTLIKIVKKSDIYKG